MENMGRSNIVTRVTGYGFHERFAESLISIRVLNFGSPRDVRIVDVARPSVCKFGCAVLNSILCLSRPEMHMDGMGFGHCALQLP